LVSLYLSTAKISIKIYFKIFIFLRHMQ
jgi:hypothetical protein